MEVVVDAVGIEAKIPPAFVFVFELVVATGAV